MTAENVHLLEREINELRRMIFEFESAGLWGSADHIRATMWSLERQRNQMAEEVLEDAS